MRIERLWHAMMVAAMPMAGAVVFGIKFGMGASVKLVGKGTRTNSVYEPILRAEQLALLTASPVHEPCDGDARKFRLGIEAMRLGYGNIVFDKELLKQDATLEWVTPGHPLFEVVREEVLGQVQEDLKRGAVFFDLHSTAQCCLDVFSASIRDGRGNTISRRLFVVQTSTAGELSIKQPTIFLDLAVAPVQPAMPDDSALPDRNRIEVALLEQALHPLLEESRREREREVSIISRHIELSLNSIINRENLILAELISQKESGSGEQGLEGRIKISEDKLLKLDHRLQNRRRDLEQERQCSVGDIQHIGRAWALPHPERESPGLASMVNDPEIERIAIQAVIAHEEAEGRVVESVDSDNRGFDLISRRPHPDDPKTAIDVRFIEVKGRAHTGEIALTSNEFKTAQRLANDYWLYVVFHCGTPTQNINVLRNPATLDWQPIVTIEHYRLKAESIRNPVELRQERAIYTGSPPAGETDA